MIVALSEYRGVAESHHDIRFNDDATAELIQD